MAEAEGAVGHREELETEAAAGKLPGQLQRHLLLPRGPPRIAFLAEDLAPDQVDVAKERGDSRSARPDALRLQDGISERHEIVHFAGAEAAGALVLDESRHGIDVPAQPPGIG